MANPFLEQLGQRALLCDGAMGTQLYGRGIDFDECFDALNLTQPDVVREIHQSYIEAGADIIETNTYGANRFKLEPFGLADKVRQINHRGMKLAREAREIAGTNTLIAGAVGPLGVLLQPYGPLTEQAAHEAFAEQIGTLLEQGADLLMFETFSDLREMLIAVKAAKQVGDLPIVAQMTFAEDGRTVLGNTPEEVVRKLVELGVAVVGVNCSVGSQRVFRVVQSMRAVNPTIPISAQPNAGWPTERHNRVFYPSSPEYMADYARRMVEELNVQIVGGCCGTTPQHISNMHSALQDLNPASTLNITIVDDEVPSVQLPSKSAETTQLGRMLADGAFVTSVEIDPPKGHNPRRCLEGARQMQAAGVNFINVADSPMARVRMSALPMCNLIQQQVGMETILHFTTRDRSLMGLQSDLLGAHALGVRNILALKGDPPSFGAYPGTSGVFDVDTIGLVKVIAGMNSGVDTAGNDIGTPTNFLIGVALNINAEDPDWEIDRLHQKVAAGAHYAMTQISYDATELDRFLDKLGPLPIPIILGLMPVQSYRHASFLHNEVPGITLPKDVLERMKEAGANGRAVGVQVSQEILAAAYDRIQGVYIMPSFGRYEMAAEVLEVLKAANA
ncbi:MAG TPA: bifunctional homocysteine S-methyltransferase/methylenetetrahydrofolate reductase [Herpetosiphon sp.]|uniref:Homocysteine S-methyltransferase n=1 Tax=Herpetosiphon aurantiacus (strain ATCC 23779 / DSM 785 / 114-95) TaxID=316274 RepID=A9B657_HERA2|nr:bifunctional homocysteine S-methyltransferase/methylenetetrahydrofolate reductase [Herpetosiphon sp.]ABX06268.1 homocysteine S-methyltransferase [Herpetosiphon aurantiacus DSM 785]HBW48848.1 bifunctional homocysteine S-methyltransferase/methylenetetrahydrofolate reductase [Herpetosiphon sp.]